MLLGCSFDFSSLFSAVRPPGQAATARGPACRGGAGRDARPPVRLSAARCSRERRGDPKRCILYRRRAGCRGYTNLRTGGQGRTPVVRPSCARDGLKRWEAPKDEESWGRGGPGTRGDGWRLRAIFPLSPPRRKNLPPFPTYKPASRAPKGSLRSLCPHAQAHTCPQPALAQTKYPTTKRPNIGGNLSGGQVSVCQGSPATFCRV